MARIQDAPQSTTYTKKADKKKTAKPVGARFTNKLAKRLGKKTTTKPSASDIEKYLGKGVYKEKRADKSDIKPKDKFAKGGQASPQSGSYTARADKKKTAKPVGVRFTDKLAKRLGKKATTKPTLAEAEKYMGKGVYKENRKDKSDINPKNRFAKGGKTKSKKFEYQVMFYDGEENLIDSEYYVDDPSDKEVTELAIKIRAKTGQLYRDKYDSGEYMELVADYDFTDMYAKGGKTEQTYAQSTNYNEFRDITKEAKPVGYRYTNALAKRLGVSPLSKPSKAHIDKYLDKGVYWENRADKSDQNRKDKLEHGGDTEYAKGGVAEHGLRKGDKIVEGKGGNFLVVINDGKEYMIDISKGERYPMKGNTVYPAVKNPKKEDGGDVEYAKGGQAPSYKETYFGNKWTKKADKEEKGKRVGYRYTDKLAKRLGVNKYAKPTDAHIEKYLGNGIYFENRKDKSDVSPKDKLAKGGTTQTYPQSQSYNEFRDITKEAKPVGYRYTDALAKRLGVSPLSKPSKAHIDKYLDKGVYWENRADKSDQNRKDKLEDGGEMAKGGGTRISNSEASSYAENHQPFRGNNLEAKTLENGDYVVLSYGYYPIWYWNKKEDKWYQNKDKFSQTTARHITASRPTYDAQVVSRNEMDNMMAKSLEGNGFMALGGELSSFVVTQ